jgi:hypothetical protein
MTCIVTTALGRRDRVRGTRAATDELISATQRNYVPQGFANWRQRDDRILDP